MLTHARMGHDDTDQPCQPPSLGLSWTGIVLLAGPTTIDLQRRSAVVRLRVIALLLDLDQLA